MDLVEQWPIPIPNHRKHLSQPSRRMSPMSDLLFACEWGSPEGRSPTPLTGKKEITMTQSRHE